MIEPRIKQPWIARRILESTLRDVGTDFVSVHRDCITDLLAYYEQAERAAVFVKTCTIFHIRPDEHSC